MSKQFGRTGQLKITVAVCTRRRQVMLASVLDSWSKMELPQGCDVQFLVIENDEESHSREVIEHENKNFPAGQIQYALETEPGIPFARNRSAKEAISNGSDLLAFIDDDEVVQHDWLVRLLDGYRKSDAVLLGAPLRIAPPQGDLTLWQRNMHKCVGARYTRKENRATRRANLNETPGVTIVTNNWLGQLSLFSEHRIWFDENMRFTGGTDSKFYSEVVAAGLPTGWVNDAFVYEVVPSERLTFGYQYARGRDQSNTNFSRKIAHNPSAKFSALGSVPPKILSVAILAILVPLTMGRTLLDLSRTLGWIAGRLGALFGRKSELYVDTTGH